MSSLSRPGSRSALGTVITVAVVAFALTLTTAAQARVGPRFSPSATIDLSPGITYSKGTMRTAGRLRQSVRVATVSPSHPDVRLRALLSNDLVVRKERPSRLAERNSSPGMRAMVATNGDRSVMGRGDAYAAPHSMLVSGGELMVAQACTRPTLGIDGAGGARIDDVRVHITMTKVGKKVSKQVHRVNTHRDDNKPVLFTSRFASSTLTKPGGIEIVLSLPDVLRPSGVQEVQVLEVRHGAGDTHLEPGRAVLSWQGPGNEWVKRFRPGQHWRLETSVVRKVNNSCGGTIAVAPDWGGVVEAVGGNYFTVRNGAIAAPSSAVYPDGSQRHPRTNVGVTADGRVVMVTVDGRQPGYSIGVTLAEMGRLMRSLGATSAFNLDGGGSSVMARRNLRTGRFVIANRPSDGRERIHSTALAAYQVTPLL
jgi:hypothetical protein